MNQTTILTGRTLFLTACLLVLLPGSLYAQASPSPTSTPTPTPTAAASPVPTPVIQLVSPKVTYPSKGKKRYELTVIGSNLGRKANASTILVYVDDNIVRPEWIDDEAKAGFDKVYGIVQQDDTQLQLLLPWPQYSGALKVKVAVGDKVSSAFEIVVAKIESPSKAAWIAALVTLGLLGLPLLLVSQSRDSYRVGDKKYGVLAAFFLDKETDTYSLSKFQFYIWTSVAIFGYIYLALVESLVQGKAVFPEIPENLPGIIMISAATGALATGITSAKGPKGAGDIHPSLGDFVTAGGLVVAERFQFFIWTMLGAVTFLFFTLSSDPATLHDLPKIPDSFLQIMGISSLGYLSGKLARKPGPVIDQILVDPPDETSAKNATELTLTISGQKLSKDAGLRIDDTEVVVAKDKRDETIAVLDTTTGPQASTKEDQGEFYKKLRFDIYKPKPEWRTAGKHKVTITNDDGKAASWDYTITSPDPAPVTAAPVTAAPIIPAPPGAPA